MRSLTNFKTGLKSALAASALMSLAGCLVSEQPILDATNGRAAPLSDGAYLACASPADDEDADCNVFTVTQGADGALSFEAEDEDPAMMRFRRIARGAYAVQSAEDDSFVFYYGAGDSKRFELTMMNCKDLPSALRARQIKRGDLATESDEFEICTVNTLKGLTDAAKAYHRGQTTGDEDATIILSPAPAEPQE